MVTKKVRCVTAWRLDGAPVGQQVMALLPGGEERLPEVHHTTPDPAAADVVQQWPPDGVVRLVTPGDQKAS